MSDWPESVYGGIRVLELTQGIAGAAAGMHLGDFGASVLKVVTPGADRNDPGWLYLDRNKEVAELDVIGERGQIRRLTGQADVVIADANPGELEKLGLDATTLSSSNRGLVFAWLPPYGTYGRWSQLPDDPVLLYAVSSVADSHVAVEDVPVFPVTPAISYGHGALAAAAIAGALLERCRTGTGRTLTVSGLHALAAMNCPILAEAPGVVRIGSKMGTGSPHVRMYQAGDGAWFFLFALTPKFFFKALEALDMVEVMAAPGIEGDFQRLYDPTCGGAVARLLEKRFQEKSCKEWCELLMSARVPIAPIQDRAQWLESDLVAVNRIRTTFQHDILGAVDMPGVPVLLHETPGHAASLPAAGRAENAWAGRESANPIRRSAIAELDRPLQGLRVIDLSTFIAGPFATAVLADFGADVTKVEPFDGDPYRLVSVAFVAVNQRKRGLALDLRSSDGYEAFVSLVSKADVLVHNFPPGLDQELKVDYDSLREINPRLVHYSVSAFGREGPLARTPGFDQLLQGLSGLAAVQGGAGPPVSSMVPVHDVGAGMIGAFGILAALFARESSGFGQEVTTSLASIASMVQAGELTSFAGRPPPPVGGPDFPGPQAMRRYYRCTDGWIAIAAQSPEEAQRLLAALGCEELLNGLAGQASDATIASAISEWLASMSVVDALDLIGSQGVACSSVLSLDDALDDPWLLENDFFHEVADRALGICRVVKSYAAWSQTVPESPRTAPAIGEDTQEILESFGFTTDRIRQLLADGAIASL